MLYEKFSEMNEAHKVRVLEVFEDECGTPRIRYEFKGGQETTRLDFLLESIQKDNDFVYVSNLSALKPWFDKQESQKPIRKGKQLTKQGIFKAVDEAFPNTFRVEGDVLSRYVSGDGSGDCYVCVYDCYSFDVISQNKVRVKSWTFTDTDRGGCTSNENISDLDEQDVIPYISQRIVSWDSRR